MEYSKSSWIVIFLCELCALVQCLGDSECWSNGPEHSNGTCQEIRSICSEFENDAHLADCFPNSFNVPVSQDGGDIDFGPDVTSCLEGGEFKEDSCTSNRINPNESNYALPNNLRLELSSISVNRFNITIAWNHSDARWFRGLEGYEIRVKKVHKMSDNEDKIACLCVRNINQRQYTVPKPLWYDPREHNLEVTVSTFPRVAQEPRINNNTIRDRIDWPANCLVVNHTAHDCSPPRLEKPTNLKHRWSQLSSSDNDTKLDLSWHPPPHMNDSSYRIPHVYFITIYLLPDYSSSIVYQVNNTQNVSVYGLNSSLQYLVLLQAYEKCSGFIPISSHSIGYGQCGKKNSLNLSGLTLLPPPVTTLQTTMSNTMSTTISTTVHAFPTNIVTTEPLDLTKDKMHSIGLWIGVVISVIILAAVVMIITAVTVSRYKRSTCTRRKWEPGRGSTVYQPRFQVPTIQCSRSHYVMVVFPLDTPPKKEEYIRARLTELEFYEGYNIEVQFIKDFNSAIVATTWDKQFQVATNILLVCTPEFCQEWANVRTDGSPTATLFNLLRADLTSTVNASNKYTAVVFNERQALPNNNLLSRIPRISLENEWDTDNLLCHITNTPRYARPQTAPHRVLVSSPTDVSYEQNSHTRTNEHLGLNLEHVPCKYLDLPMTPTSDQTDETLSTSSSECSIETA